MCFSYRHVEISYKKHRKSLGTRLSGASNVVFAATPLIVDFFDPGFHK